MVVATVQQTLRAVPLAPVTADGTIPPINDVAAVIFRNAGTATVNLWGGAYTLDSKETLSLNVTEVGGQLNLYDIPITFDTGSGPLQRLQIIVLKASPNNC